MDSERIREDRPRRRTNEPPRRRDRRDVARPKRGIVLLLAGIVGAAVLVLIVAGVGIMLLLRSAAKPVPQDQGIVVVPDGAKDAVKEGADNAMQGAANDPIARMPGLIAYWKFDEGQGPNATDVSPHRQRAELKGARWGEGVRGKAVQFDADGQHLDYGAAPQLNFQADDAFSFAAWFKTAAPTATLLSQRSSKDNSPSIDVYLVFGGVGVFVRQDNQEFGPSGSIRSGQPVSDGKWHHFVLTRQGPTIELFVDGISQGRSGGAGGAITTDLRKLGQEPLWVNGRTPLGLHHSLVGAVDELCVFNRVLTEGEIRTLSELPVGAR